MIRIGRAESRINPNELDPVHEFRTSPIGHHSPSLEAILNILRSGPLHGKYCLVCLRPHETWVLARLSDERGKPPTILHERRYNSIEEAEWDVFKLRWEAETGTALPEDLL